MNTIIITGCNLTRDPELRFTQTQKAVCNMSVADNQGYGEKKTVSFFNVIAWNKVAENCNKYLKKGSKINVYGMLKQRSYETKDSQKRNAFEIIVNNIEFVNTKQKEDKSQNTDTNFTDDPAIEFPDFGNNDNSDTQDDALPF